MGTIAEVPYNALDHACGQEHIDIQKHGPRGKTHAASTTTEQPLDHMYANTALSAARRLLQTPCSHTGCGRMLRTRSRHRVASHLGYPQKRWTMVPKAAGSDEDRLHEVRIIVSTGEKTPLVQLGLSHPS